MVDLTRHAPSGRFRQRRSGDTSRGLSQVYQGRARRAHGDVLQRDHTNTGLLKWQISICVAGAIGILVMGVVIHGSIDRSRNSEGVLERLSQTQSSPPKTGRRKSAEHGLNWALPKSDQLTIASGALSARYVIHEQIRTKRNNRPFIEIRPYLRITSRLTPMASRNRDVIPPFNPLTLYSAPASKTRTSDNIHRNSNSGRVDVRVVELLGGILPGTDGQELDTTEVGALVKRAQMRAKAGDGGGDGFEKTGQLPSGLTPGYLGNNGIAPVGPATNTTVLTRTIAEPDQTDDETESAEARVVRVGPGDTLQKILQDVGTVGWQASTIIDAMQSTFPPEALRPGQEIHFRLVPSLASPGTTEPLSFSIFDPGHIHRVTVKRDAAGEFTASTTLDQASLFRAMLRDDNAPKVASLYQSFYDAALTQNLPPELILKILRIHVYGIDFRRRVQNGDQVQMFFELKNQINDEPRLGELLYTAISSAGEIHRFWRFRTPDGAVEYYDENGENSKTFLMRKPVRGLNVRLTSGFGYRYHPLLNRRRMHAGIDWAAPYGTPILAAGKGVVEEAGRKGWYGNYVRLRHANGYKTAYAHMSRFGHGIKTGTKVRQGQVIGYIGSTGLSSGPHLHYEVLISSRHVDPLKMKVSRARKLSGEQLAAFRAERNRINELMARPPVKTDTR
ncbi:MAG: M23 family metallopeptidase [Hyphomicrobiaceae bacterium]|nr:M23 family metallopeptidase [Hyphomicrobiaceae bacterium]